MVRQIVQNGGLVASQTVKSGSSPSATMPDAFEDHCWKDVVPADVLELYRVYRRPLGLKGSVALVAIDLWACVFPSARMPVLEAAKEDPRSCGQYAWDAAPRIQELFALARQHRWPVAFTTSAALAGAARDDARATHRQAPAGEQATGYRIDDRFPVLAGDLMVLKKRASAFFQTELHDWLVGKLIDTVVICGESTSGCVRASAVDAYSLGFHTVVVEDCVFDRNELSHKVNLFDLHHKYADVIRLSDLLGEGGSE